VRQRSKEEKTTEEVSYYLTSLDFDIALAMLDRDTMLKRGRATKQKYACVSASYRDHLLKNCVSE